jgi:hypothetical protein
MIKVFFSSSPASSIFLRGKCVILLPPRMIEMPVPRSSTAQSKPAAAKQAPASGAKQTKPAQRAVSRRGRSKAAQMLREIQIDGKALSVQIERLRHRFL